jgi:signal transduction histidine kinase
MDRIETILKYFLHTSLSRSVINHRKGIILVFAHFYVFIALSSLSLLSNTIKNTSLFSTLCALICIVVSLFLFKKKGRINPSGNMLTFSLCVALIPILLKTGGINSSFMPWLYAIAFVMVLVENLIWATFWFSFCSLFCIALYIADPYFPNLNVSNCTKFDSMTSYLSIGCFLFLSLIVFEGHQVFVIKILKSKNEELKAQKKVIAEHLAELEKISTQLSVSNQELEIFAFAASHDLKEPLRMITMYTQILEMKLKPLLNNTTNEYMGFVIDGVKRMQKLLDNLLEYSLLGKKDKKLEEINLNKKIERVLLNLTVVIQETQAQINFSNLPTITAAPTDMLQLFQNVIANALKFRKKDIAPIVNISCTESVDEYMFIVEDNGIGIKTEDQERIFNLFTRLHTNKQYEGTGIGLATCKKILTNLNGKISVSSVEGKGTTFYFFIPKSNVSNMVGKGQEKSVIHESERVSIN